MAAAETTNLYIPENLQYLYRDGLFDELAFSLVRYYQSVINGEVKNSSLSTEEARDQLNIVTAAIQSTPGYTTAGI